MSNNLKIVRFCQFCNSTTNNSNKWPEVCRYCKVCYVTIWQQQLTLSYRYSCSPKGRQAENHNHRNQPHTCIEIETHTTRSLCMVNTAINMNRPRLRPTTAMRWLHNAAATLQLIPSFGLQRTSLKFDPCYISAIDTCRNKISADLFHVTISQAQKDTHQGHVCFFFVGWPSSCLQLDRGLMSD